MDITLHNVAGIEGATQFARAMVELGVRLIFARSPQARARDERIAGTFQDGLVTELRLAGAAARCGAGVRREAVPSSAPGRWTGRTSRLYSQKGSGPTSRDRTSRRVTGTHPVN